MDNKVEQGFDYQEAENKIKSLQTLKSALSFEISKKQATAEELSNRIKYQDEKIEERKQLASNILKEVEGKIAESEALTKSIRALRIEHEHVKNDIESQRKSLDYDKSGFSLEKASFIERNELKEETLAKREKELEENEKTIKHKLKEVDDRLNEILAREQKLSSNQETLNATLFQAQLDKREAEIMRIDAQKMLDEGTSIKKIADEKKVDLDKYSEDLVVREKSLKTDIEYHEAAKKQMKTEARELDLERNRINQIKYKFRLELENSQLETKMKKELIAELGQNEVKNES